MKCVYLGKPYTIFGYKGKQVRDNIHSLDLVSAFFEFFQAPPQGGLAGGEVYNMGGSRFSNCSMLEAIELCQAITGKELDYSYTEVNRTGDHIWYISDISKFQKHYPQRKQQYNLRQLLEDIYVKNAGRWLATEKVAKIGG